MPERFIDPAAGLPDLEAAHAIAGLRAAVEVWRDPYGVPHIRAENRDDAFLALGFVHAQDRLWQMEAMLRRGTGHYAAWVGKRALNADILARRVDTRGASIRDFALLGSDARAMLESYARGVNAYIALERWPIEYALLETEPQIWEAWHSIAVMRQLGFLMGSVWWKLWRAAALPVVGIDKLDALRFDDGGNDFLCMPTGAESGRYRALLDELKPSVEALLTLSPLDLAGAGSNNWAVAPERTATGRPLLAGDPHRLLETPNMYAQAHLACDEFDVIGLTTPGVPGFPHFGHSESIAWCVTHAFFDIHDLFVERFDREGDRYVFQDEWVEASRREETIKVRGEDDALTIVATTRHGPVIAGDPRSGVGLALQSMQFAVDDRSFDCMIPMLRARSLPEFYASTREWGLMDHNLVAADVKGAIGHRVRAKIPNRPRSSGWLPAPGWTGDYEWKGYVPFEAMPAAVNPPEGLIVTANNRVVEERGPFYFSTDCMPPHRAKRILARLKALDKASVEDMAAVHRDIVSIPGVEWREQLRRMPATGAAADLRDAIASWSGEMATNSEGAAAYAAMRAVVTRLVAEKSGLARIGDDPYLQVSPGVFAETQLWWSVPQLLRADDTRLLGGASWDELLATALDEVAGRSSRQSWGVAHQPKLTHPLSVVFPEAAHLLDKPAASIPGDNDTVFATGYVARLGFKAQSGSLCRYVFDVGAWDNCRWVVFHGASGHPHSKWYDNQNAIWAKGEMMPMLYDWTTIAGTSTAHQRLTPIASQLSPHADN
jgi:penicillin amidase